MRLNILIFVALALLGYGSALYFDHLSRPILTPAPAEKTFADFPFTALDGKAYNLSGFKGKIVLVNFWATWCAPCVVEFPLLLETAAQNPDDLVLLAFSADTGEEVVLDFLQKINKAPPANVIIALDDRQHIAQEIFETFRLPETYVLDRELALQNKLVGANWDEGALKALIDRLLQGV